MNYQFSWTEFSAQAHLGLAHLGDSGVSKDRAKPKKPCLAVYPPTSALGPLPGVAYPQGGKKEYSIVWHQLP
jgi:hypothetical protein